MKLCFTKSSQPLSILIRLGLKQPVSHFIIVFDDNLVFESNLLGTILDYFPLFKTKAEVVYTINVPMTKELEDKLYDQVIPKFLDHPYDWSGFFYFMYRAILNRLFKTPFPKKNAWAHPNWFICSGLVKCLDSPYVPENIVNKVRQIEDAEMISPYELYLLLKG